MTFSEEETVNARKSFFARKWKRYSFHSFIGFAVWHYIYYTIEFNEKVRKPEERRDMAYVHWLKKKFPILRQFRIRPTQFTQRNQQSTYGH
ncbi:Beta-glucosidase [Dirofilaria immitis]